MSSSDPTSRPEAPEACIKLDIRRLRPAEMAQRIFEALAALPAKATLVARAEQQPVLLYEMLAADGWRRATRQDGGGIWEILIWRPEDER